jgi:hypothetical protein
MPTGFELEDSVIENFGPKEAVDFFRDILWASVSEACSDRSDVHVPVSIFDPDEGIDAVTENADSNEGVIPKGKTGYQVKAGDLEPRECRDEVLDDDDEEEGEYVLKSMVQDVVEDGGGYVLILCTDITEAKRQRRLDKLNNAFGDAGHPDTEVNIYTSSQLTGFVNRFPSLVAKYSTGFGYGIDYDAWGRSNPIQSIETYVPSDEQVEHLEQIRDLLNSQDDCSVVRISGISGLGKTRLAYELLSPNHLRRQVIYADASNFRGSSLQNRLEMDEHRSAILVLDDCSPEDHKHFHERFSSRSDRLAVITVSDSLKEVSADYSAELDPMATEDIEEILENERADITESGRNRIAEFSEGFPQITALLVKNIDDDSSTSLLETSNEDILDRLIVGSQEDNDFERDEVKQVLEAFALFERVGWKDEERNRHPEVEWLIEEFGIEENIGVRKFERIVQRQRERGILQGEYYLSLKPLPLATYLLQSYWRAHGDRFGSVFEEMPEEMVDRFGERIPYMNAFESGREWVADILGPRGWFDEDAVFYSPIGSRLFLKFTEASAEDALDAASRFLESKSADELQEFSGKGRRNMVWALQRMAVWENLFEDAAYRLLALGEAETEHQIANNASGEFANLFSPGSGRVSRTEVPPSERLPILKDAVRSEGRDRQKLGLSAASTALTTDHFSKTSGPERQGARPLPALWMPETRGEIWEYYQEVWSFLREEIEDLDEPVRSEAVDILLRSAGGIAKQSLELSEMVRSTLEEFSDYDWIDDTQVIQTALRIVDYDIEDYPDDETEEWQELAHQLSETSFRSRLKRYVGLSAGIDAERGVNEDAYQATIERLAEEAVSNPGAFEEEISWLVTGEPSRAREFGSKLAEVDKDREILDLIIDAVKQHNKDISPRLLVGYLSKLQDINKGLRQDVLDQFRNDGELIHLLPYLSVSSGIRDEDVERLLEAIDSDDLEVRSLVELEPVTKAHERISEKVFSNLADRMLSEETGVCAVALMSIFHTYYIWEDESPKIDEELAFRLLTDNVFLKNDSNVQYSQMTSYHWEETVKELVETNPDTAVRVLGPIFDSLGNRGTLVRTSHDVNEVLGEILDLKPEETWEKITEALDAKDERMIWLSNWLSGGFRSEGEYPIKSVPPELIWEWVDENVSDNGILAARLIPARFFGGEEEVCLARELLKRYGNNEEIRQAVSNNYHSETIVGPTSEHYRKKKQEIEEFKQEVDHPNVLKWANEELSDLEKQIRTSEMREEGRGFF